MFTCFTMICTMDKLKTVLPSVEEREEEKDSLGSKREGETCYEDGEQGEPGGKADKEEVQEKTQQATGQVEDTFHSRDKRPLAEPIPMSNRDIKDPVMKIVGFNLNNEVVKMRKEVKRVRALIIRKLTRRIGALKKKKGKDADIERNQRRAIRLLEEIQAMKVLPPDLVTKTALQKNLNLNQVCKNPKSTISDRGLTRIATHPQFIKRIDSIKAASKTFKEERITTEGQGGKVKGQNKFEKFPPARERQSGKKKQEKTVEQLEVTESDNKDFILKKHKDAAVENPREEKSRADHLANTADDINKEMPENKNVISVVKDMMINNIPGPMAGKKLSCNTASTVLQQKTNKEESDMEPLDDEEKEYFDDSTEERFHRQSSESEESDDDDFFVGKVSKLKKKTKQNNGDRKRELMMSPSKQDQGELPVVESKLKAKTAQLQTVFCPTLSVSGMDKGAGRGRGKGKLSGKETVKGFSWKSNCNKKSMFQKQGREAGCNSGSKQGGSHQESQLMVNRAQGRGNVGKQKVSKDGTDWNSQAKMQALHPSWEASKKRKEQQGQILAFRGKKIKFDDD